MIQKSCQDFKCNMNIFWICIDILEILNFSYYKKKKTPRYGDMWLRWEKLILWLSNSPPPQQIYTSHWEHWPVSQACDWISFQVH